jgi:hypothetical protein
MDAASLGFGFKKIADRGLTRPEVRSTSLSTSCSATAAPKEVSLFECASRSVGSHCRATNNALSKYLESKRTESRIPFSKAMNTITTRPFLTIKLATLVALALLLLIQSI